MCADGVWGPVCGVNIRVAFAICNTLGYGGGKRNHRVLDCLHDYFLNLVKGEGVQICMCLSHIILMLKVKDTLLRAF